MGLLVFLARKHSVLSSINDVEYRMTQLNRKLQDLQQYSANISDGKISMSDMMNTPGSMFGRQMMFMQYSHNASIMGAQQQYQMMQPMLQMQMQQMPDANSRAMYQQWAFQNLYEQQRQQAAKQEEKLLNQQEKEIQQEITKLQAQEKMLSNELEAIKQAENSAYERLKPNYVG